jgi:hypothetical protein
MKRNALVRWLLIIPWSVTALGAESAWLRVNHVGYLPADPKIAILSSDKPLDGRFCVGDWTADVGPDLGAWGPFPRNYRLDFTPVRAPGRYRVCYRSIESPWFAIGPDVYRDVPGKLVEFLRLQRCGDNPVTGQTCHQEDGFDTMSSATVDLVGGWHDAGVRLKHMITTSYCVGTLFLAGAADEARYGTGLIRKLHPEPNVIYVQIGDDRDHVQPLTMWHDDQSDDGRGPGQARAAWRATGRPEGPKLQNRPSGLANLAGRSSGARPITSSAGHPGDAV